MTDQSIYRPDLPYRCPDCVTRGEKTCPHPRPTVEQVRAGAREFRPGRDEGSER